jgi:anhydro-N-acetylmuramic acid kinase
MFKENYSVLGVMSGTSLDGVDLVYIDFAKRNNKWTFSLLESETVPYDKCWINKLQVAVAFSAQELQKINEDYTFLLGNIINNFVQNHNITNLDAVCSHGHTILHQPQNGFTLQIGNLPIIAELIQQTVVCDFRVQDVKLGGQGAPLVPIGDQILFSEFDFCLNLGGFSNVSFNENNSRIAFDIAPVNTVLNFYANQLNLDFDNKGIIARSGKCNQDLFNQLNSLDFYAKNYPKSLGFEFVKEIILPIIQSYNLSVPDKMNTFIEHIAYQTSKALDKKEGKIFVTGGGAYNDFLTERLQFHLPKIKIIIPESKILEFKEALIFGLLGVLKLRGEINVLSSVTGASRDHSSGEIFVPNEKS